MRKGETINYKKLQGQTIKNYPKTIMIPERGPQTVFKQFLSGAIKVLQSIECNLCSAT